MLFNNKPTKAFPSPPLGVVTASIRRSFIVFYALCLTVIYAKLFCPEIETEQ